MKFSIILEIFGALVAIGSFIFLIMSFVSFDPSAIYYIVASIFGLLNGLMAIGVARVLREVMKKDTV
ncbi:hypothetical protein CF394_05070 [Tetzosporium hominis]|uniref:Uncharacterized protein n=1 Tax=Tetzosporium hominis TaxID=2020506 RepID=A0A264W4Z9_9BACL|nr:hypothetical protein [Tetzosporium hominis]OZS78660.1 hypothetical protein CF394_05070 [Tetzosporium hominis]